MKYIRTKNTIKLFNGPYHGYELDRQADTIEELCDEFVFVDEFGKKDLLDDDYKAKLQEFGTFSVVHALMEQDRPKELYGAVWTDKGLIFVAEMNEELEMELK